MFQVKNLNKKGFLKDKVDNRVLISFGSELFINPPTLRRHYYVTGAIRLEGEKIAFEAEQVLFIGYEAAWGIMEEFTEMKINSEAQPLRSTVDYREEGSKLALITACNDVILSMCAPHPVYSSIS
ncbi:hypothetical protein [Cyclobacterium plantarum]|uniref:hypothetical protein n=1 Tax=Cyclobacterium plantarum TaxID=2716263 RepID=UPI001C9E64EE|nr:hypothetical protein [Cyclobacterium plantarum]